MQIFWKTFTLLHFGTSMNMIKRFQPSATKNGLVGGAYIVRRHCENTAALPHDCGSPSTSSFGRLASKPEEHKHGEMRPSCRWEHQVFCGSDQKLHQLKPNNVYLDVKLVKTFFPANSPFCNIAPRSPWMSDTSRKQRRTLRDNVWDIFKCLIKSNGLLLERPGRAICATRSLPRRALLCFISLRRESAGVGYKWRLCSSAFAGSSEEIRRKNWERHGGRFQEGTTALWLVWQTSCAFYSYWEN